MAYELNNRKEFLNIGDLRYALVEWRGEKKLSVLPMSQFFKTNEPYVLEKYYKCIWHVDNRKYHGKLLLIGLLFENNLVILYLL
jgi:hypothetical protein